MALDQRRMAWGEIDDAVLRSGLRNLDRRLRAKLGPGYAKLILFGSRARGDHEPDSDADVAVVMRESDSGCWALTRSILDETYEILLDSGLYIEPRVIRDVDLRHPELSPDPFLTSEILRDGVTL